MGIDRVQVEPDQPVPVITYHAPSLSRSAAITALEAAGRTWRITCNTREINGVLAAARAGIGICVLASSRVPADLRVADRAVRAAAAARRGDGADRQSRARRTAPVEALSQAIVNLPLAPLRP